MEGGKTCLQRCHRLSAKSHNREREGVYSTDKISGCNTNINISITTSLVMPPSPGLVNAWSSSTVFCSKFLFSSNSRPFSFPARQQIPLVEKSRELERSAHVWRACSSQLGQIHLKFVSLGSSIFLNYIIIFLLLLLRLTCLTTLFQTLYIFLVIYSRLTYLSFQVCIFFLLISYNRLV